MRWFLKQMEDLEAYVALNEQRYDYTMRILKS